VKRALLLFVLVSMSCKSRIGDSCREANEDCLDEHTKLVCKNGRFMPITCEGEKGCSVDKAMGKARCDWSGNKIGSKCDDRLTGMRMCRDVKSTLACRSGHFDVLRCRGPLGCKAQGPEPDSIAQTCDNSIAKEGDGCDPVWSSAPACDDEAKKELVCNKTGVFAFKRHCRGPKGCVVKDGKATCDDSVQEVGDPCESLPEQCNKDGRAMLICNFGMVAEKACPGPEGCKKSSGGVVSCDTGFSYIGVPCEKKGQLACTKRLNWEDSVDAQSKLLECDGVKFVEKKTCKGGCNFEMPSTFDCLDKEKDKPKKKP